MKDMGIDIHKVIDQHIADEIYSERLLLKPILDWARSLKEKPYPVRQALERFDEDIGDKETYWKRIDRMQKGQTE